MSKNGKYEPSPDFVSKTMKRVFAYETSKKPFFIKVGVHDWLQRSVLAVGGALFGVLNATTVL